MSPFFVDTAVNLRALAAIHCLLYRIHTRMAIISGVEVVIIIHPTIVRLKELVDAQDPIVSSHHLISPFVDIDILSLVE
jgi:hypothetical protein